MTDPADATLAHALSAMEPYLPDLVIVGGWAHRLFRFHPWAGGGGFQPLMTDDADVLASLPIRSREQTIHDLLMKHRFRVELSGGTPPVTKYFPGASRGFHVEFIAGRRGSGTNRAGRRDTTRIASGITVQLLPHASLLGIDPWTVNLDPQTGARLSDGGLAVRVANPVAYLVQKVLTAPRPDRSPLKRGKDVLYIHDTLILMSPSLANLAAEWTRIRPGLTAIQVKRFDETRQSEFLAVTNRIREASRIATASGRAAPPDADRIRRVIERGLEEVFGTQR